MSPKSLLCARCCRQSDSVLCPRCNPDLADPSGQEKPASVSQGAIDRELCRRSAPLAGHLGSSHDDELTAEDIRYLKADHIWGDMGRGGL